MNGANLAEGGDYIIRFLVAWDPQSRARARATCL